MNKKRIFLSGWLLLIVGAFVYFYWFLSPQTPSVESFINEQNALRHSLPAAKDSAFYYGSKISSIPVNEQNVANLRMLGLIWGFLKYHHPNIAAGNYNMDAELFRFLPGYLQVQNETERDALLLRWVENFGTYKPEKKYNRGHVKMEPDLAWIQTLSQPLAQKLEQIRQARRSGENYYVALGIEGYYPVFFEEKYSTIRYLDAGMRLLSLFRYWNIIQYFFPYRNLIEEDWKDVLGEFIPLFLRAENGTDYTLTTLQLIARIQDTHANIVGDHTELVQHLGYRHPLLAIVFAEGQAVVSKIRDTALYEAGWEIGDVITHVEGRTVETLVAEKLPLTPASNKATKLRNIASLLLRSNRNELTVQVKDKGIKTIRTVSMRQIRESVQEEQHTADTSAFKVLPGNIGYIHNGLLKRSQINRMWQVIRQTNGLIIDNRNYPSDMPLYELCALLANRSKAFVTFSKASVREPGQFVLGRSMQTGRNRQGGYRGRIAILVNENTQSASEFHAMAYQALDHAVVIGSTTAAADGNVTAIYLPGNILTYISGIGVYYPDGRETQRVGIIPDIEIRPTIRGIKAGEDEVLEKALQVLGE